MSFNEFPCKCCICTSLCRTGIPIIRFSGGSFSPPSITRRIPGSDRDEVVWLHPKLNTAYADLSCAWNLVSGSVFEQTWNSVPKGAGYSAALSTLGISEAELSALYVSGAANRIADTQHQELPQLWNDILDVDQLRGPFNVDGEADPPPLATWQEGTLVTKSLMGCFGHIVFVELPVLSRAISDEGRTDYEEDPFTVDTLVGCDASGGNPIATLRLRMEHGQLLTRPSSGGSWSKEPVSSHSFALHKDTPSFFQTASNNWELVERKFYVELLGGGGEVVNSYFVPQGLSNFFTDRFQNAASIGLGGVGNHPGRVEWQISLTADAVNVTARSGSGAIQIFPPYAVATGTALSRQFIGVSFVRGNGRQLSISHSPMTRSLRERTVERATGERDLTENVIIPLSPSTPATLSPYCDPANELYQRNQAEAFRPWALLDSCEWWERDSRITEAAVETNFSELLITIEGSNAGLPRGVFNLGSTSDADEPLVDNTFWFADDINEAFDNGVIQRVEWSATINGNEATRCNEYAEVFIVGRALLSLNSGPSPPDAESLFFYRSYRVGQSFFEGEEINLPLSLPWTARTYYQEPGSPAASPWHGKPPFFSLADSFVATPTKFSIKLV